MLFITKLSLKYVQDSSYIKNDGLQASKKKNWAFKIYDCDAAYA